MPTPQVNSILSNVTATCYDLSWFIRAKSISLELVSEFCELVRRNVGTDTGNRGRFSTWFCLLRRTQCFYAGVLPTLPRVVAMDACINRGYLIGACTGVVYLRMLAKDVERLGRSKKQLSQTRLALLIGLIVLSSQWNQLQIMPIFLGFLTYKAALIIYVIRTSFISDFQKVGQS